MPNIDWTKLTFSYTKTSAILSCRFTGGQWGDIVSSPDDNIVLSSFAGALHYSIECFEGLKAFRGQDGKVRLFRPEENARRMQSSAEFLGLPVPSEELFIEMCIRAVKENIDFLPPYGSGASLYLRPTLIGSNPQLGVQSAKEAILLLLCSPVGAYVGGNLEPINAVIARNYDRAATYGTGRYKLGGNYAASLYSLNIAHSQGYKATLYLDPATHTYIDEFNSSNFFAIKGNTYITPKSDSILPSITNKSLEEMARNIGMNVERRRIPVEELAEFEEAGECGTAVVITPINYIDDKPFLEADPAQTTRYSFVRQGCGPKSLRLYRQITGVQSGELPDVLNWCTFIE